MQVSQGFQDNVKKYVTIDNKIKSAQDAIKILKQEKDKAGKNILIYIKTNNLEEAPINITNGKLKYFLSKTTTSISKPYIEKRLETYFKSKTKAKEATDFIYANREFNEKETIKRINNRKKDD